MSLTKFGQICRQHRIRMNKVMAHQSADLEIPVVAISAMEQGNLHASDEYISKLEAWMQLDPLEAHQLRNLSRLSSKGGRKRETGRLLSAEEVLALVSVHEGRPLRADVEGTSS